MAPMFIDAECKWLGAQIAKTFLRMLLVLLPVAAVAQIELGTVEGMVVDANGMAVEGASIVLTGSIARSAVSDAAGRFRIPFVDPGNYSLEATAAGHGNVTRIEVPVAAARTTPIRIELPEEEEAVTLEEEISLADRRLLDTASLMSNRALEGLPIPERAIGVLPLLPAIVPRSYSAEGGADVVIRGRDTATTIFLNGITLGDGSRVLRESLEQVMLITRSVDPLFGARDAELHFVTPATSTSFRGSLYASFAPDRLRAADDGESGDFLVGSAEAGGGLRDGSIHLWTFLGREHLDGLKSSTTTSALGKIDVGLSGRTAVTIFGGSNDRDDDIASFGSISGTYSSPRAIVFARGFSSDGVADGAATASIPFVAGQVPNEMRVSFGRQEEDAFAALSDFVTLGNWSLYAGLRWDGASDALQPRLLVARSQGRTLWKASANRYATAAMSTDEVQLRVERHVIPELVASIALVRSVTERSCGERSADAVEAAAWKRLSNRWMLRGHFTWIDAGTDGCAANFASYSYGIDAGVEGPWNMNLGIVLAGADASRKEERSLFQADVRLSRRWVAGPHSIDVFVDAVNVSNEDALASGPEVDEQNARGFRAGARFSY
jgi:hypothetical protein